MNELEAQPKVDVAPAKPKNPVAVLISVLFALLIILVLIGAILRAAQWMLDAL